MADNNKELIEAISKKTEESDDTELKDLMKQFIQVMAADVIKKKAAEPAPAPALQEDAPEDLAQGFEG
jgi:Pyruvate/2-oxoacid:ferredoxin oxidoreductase gamma subunit